MKNIDFSDSELGILLVNLGTPDSPKSKDVKHFLEQMLNDKYLITGSALKRKLLVNYVIIPSRLSKTSYAYKRIWKEDGSPLKIEMLKAASALEEKISTKVKIAMRYGNPSIQSAFFEFKQQDVKKIIIIPLYPHFTLSTYITLKEEIERVSVNFRDIKYKITDPLSGNEDYLNCFASFIDSNIYTEVEIKPIEEENQELQNTEDIKSEEIPSIEDKLNFSTEITENNLQENCDNNLNHPALFSFDEDNNQESFSSLKEEEIKVTQEAPKTPTPAKEIIKKDYDHVVFSFHGIPVSHINIIAGHKECCFDESCQIKGLNYKCDKNCYWKQCHVTAKNIIERSQLSDKPYSVAFQSRVGKTPWIEPEISNTLHNLARAGVKKILIIPASFPVDCIETIHELNNIGHDSFVMAGAESFELLPALNSHSLWIDALAKIAKGK